jgi:hypothetical protein
MRTERAVECWLLGLGPVRPLRNDVVTIYGGQCHVRGDYHGRVLGVVLPARSSRPQS